MMMRILFIRLNAFLSLILLLVFKEYVIWAFPKSYDTI